jgi:nicotinamide riboside kinase
MLKKIVIIGPESTGKSTLCSQLAVHYGTIWVREYAREYLLEHGTDYSYEDLLKIAQGQIRLEEIASDEIRVTNDEWGVTNDELRMTNDEWGATNDELRVTNDEWGATNDELRMTNDEEGTTNDEVRVMNEEARMTNLSTAPNSSFNIPHSILFLDTDMQVMKVWCQFVFGKCHAWIEEQMALRKYDLYLLCNTDLPWVKDELREYPDLATREKLFGIYKSMMQNQSVPWVEIKGASGERLQQAVEAVDKLLADQ